MKKDILSYATYKDVKREEDKSFHVSALQTLQEFSIS